MKMKYDILEMLKTTEGRKVGKLISQLIIQLNMEI